MADATPLWIKQIRQRTDPWIWRFIDKELLAQDMRRLLAQDADWRAAVTAMVESAEADGPLDWIHAEVVGVKVSRGTWARLKALLAEHEPPKVE